MNTIAWKLEALFKHSPTFIRFLLVGLTNTVVGLSIMFLCLNLFHLGYWSSTFYGNSVGALVSFLLNKKFTFRSNIPFTRSFPRFIIVIVACYGLSFALSRLIIESSALTRHFPNVWLDELSILTGSALYTIINYIGQKLFVFKQNLTSVDTPTR